MMRLFKLSNVKRAVVFTIVMSFIVAFAKPALRADASTWPGITSSKYMKCFTISTGNNTTAYSNSSLNSKIGTIYASDELYVYSINDSYAYLSYPTSKGRKYAYIPTRVITSNNQSHQSSVARARVTTYRRAGAISYGYVDKGDNVMRVASSGNYTQVIYPAGSVWKMGWVSTSEYNNSIAPVVNKQATVVNNANAVKAGTAGDKLASYSSSSVRCYTLASSGRVYAYSDETLSNRLNNNYIDCATDELYVVSVNKNYGSVKLSYPTSAGRKIRDFRLSDIMSNQYSSPGTYYANHRIYTYRWAGKSQYGYIENENVTVVGTLSNYTQIIYSIGGGKYKMAFIKTSDMNNQPAEVKATAAVNGNVAANIYNLAVASVGTNGRTYQKWCGLSTKDPYCAAYATYIANQAMIQAGYSSATAKSIVPKYASTSLWADWYRNRGRYYSYADWSNKTRGVKMSKNVSVSDYTPKVGDLAAIDNNRDIYGGPDHTGIVIAVDGNKITMAEGNTGAGNNLTRKVKLKTYYKGDNYWYLSSASNTVIVGFGNPAY